MRWEAQFYVNTVDLMRGMIQKKTSLIPTFWPNRYYRGVVARFDRLHEHECIYATYVREPGMVQQSIHLVVNNSKLFAKHAKTCQSTVEKGELGSTNYKSIYLLLVRINAPNALYKYFLTELNIKLRIYSGYLSKFPNCK